jgi:predicted ATPase/DNA-binding SARP family transcriptional activator
MRYRLLGPVEVIGADRQVVALSGDRERTLLATLAFGAGQPVSVSRLIDALWGEHPPATAANTLQVHVSKLRKKLAAAGAAEALQSVPEGYALRVRPDEVDATVFASLVEGATGDPAEVTTRLGEALLLWRGPALADVRSDLLQGEKTRLEELRLLALERRIEAELALGRHDGVVGELEALVRAHPLRERTRRQLMVALYRSGRQADALAVYRAGREVLAEELGIDPSAELQALEVAILRHDHELAAPTSVSPPSPFAPAPPSGTLTLLVADIEGSTRLWEELPDAMARALRRHDEILRSAIESSGGYVFKTAGDAFCAAFTTAPAAAQAARDAQLTLHAEAPPGPVGFKLRMALHTGACEGQGGEFFGPAVNRAARLEDVAHGGQVVVSQVTAELMRDKLPEHTALRDLGNHRLKDLGHPEHVFQLDLEGLPNEFPPLRTLDHPELNNNLPVQLTSFVGRAKELTEVRRLIDERRLVTLTGPGGSGKTRLALQVAADLVDDSGDGVWFADLAPLSDQGLVAAVVASAIGVLEEPGRPVADTLIDALRDRNVLIVLDNCEHLIDACAKLTESLLRSCSRVGVLATSREPLAIGGEQVFQVPALSLPQKIDAEAPSDSDAVRLFLERVRDHLPGFDISGDNARPIISICRRLDGMPLAIELAAARVHSMDLVDIETRLDRRFVLLTGSRTALPRQQTLRSVVDWSYDLLTEGERATFSRLSVFAGSFSREAAEAVAWSLGEEFQVADLLGSLVDKSLVQTDSTAFGLRYRLLETIRQYGAERLHERTEEEVEAARAAHAQFYVQLAEEAAPHLEGGGQIEWLMQLDAELDDIRQAESFLLRAAGRVNDVLGLIGRLRWYWWARDLHREILDLLEAVLPVVPERQTRERLLALCAAALLAVERDPRRAQGYAEEGLDIARSVCDSDAVAELLMDLAFATFCMGSPVNSCVQVADEAIAEARLAGNVLLTAVALGARAAVLSSVDPSEARRGFAQALKLAREIGNRYQEAIFTANLGNLELMTGERDAARMHFERSYELYAELDRISSMSVSLSNLATVALLQGAFDEAETLLKRSLLLARRVGGDYERIVAYLLLGFSLHAKAAGQLERSLRLHGATEALLVKLTMTFETFEEGLRARDLEDLRQKLGIDAFNVEIERGRSLNASDALSIALRRSRPY